MSAHPFAPDRRRPVTLPMLQQMHAAHQRIAMLTCYDSGFASLLDEAGVDALLVGDSLGMVLQGQPHTLPVRLEDVAYHTRCVASARPAAFLLADLPFGSYLTTEQALHSSAVLMQAGAHMVKLEGGGWTCDIVHALAERGIPACAHLGLTPQHVHALGGYRMQGRDEAAAALLLQQARELHAAGAAMLVLEAVPPALASAVRTALPDLVTIGIGAGPDLSGQVLVLHDILCITPRPPRFARNFMAGATDIRAAVTRFVDEVRQGLFPAAP